MMVIGIKVNAIIKTRPPGILGDGCVDLLIFGKLKEDVDFKQSRRRLKSCNFRRF